MSRIFLISANTTTGPYPVYPLGIAMIAASLCARGHEVRQFDFLAVGEDLESLRRDLIDFAPDCVGISLRNIGDVDSFSGEDERFLDAARRIAAVVRETTAVPLVVGGAGFTIMPEALLELLGADHGVVGEGESLVCELVDRLEAGRSVPRLLRSTGPLLAGTALPPPCLDRGLVDFYLARAGLVGYQTKRGCPHQCAYCVYPMIEGNRFRERSPGAVAEDLLRMRQEFGVESVFFTDAVFNDTGGHHLRLAEELIRRNVGVRWAAIFRPHRIRRDELALLKASGLCAMELGTDAASDSTLVALNKGFMFEDVLAFNRAAVSEQIPTAHFIMFGGPGETEATLREGLDNVARLEHCVVFAFAGIRILPGTGVQRLAVAEGLINWDNPLLRPVYYFAPGLDRSAISAAIERSFLKRHDRIFPPPEAQIQSEIMRRFGFRGLLWDKLVSYTH